MKTDKSLHNVCIASIKRSTIKPYDFKWTKFYENNSDFLQTTLLVDLEEHELIICSTIIDSSNFSVLTTRRLITKKDGELNFVIIKEANNKFYGDIKGYRDKEITSGAVRLKNGQEMSYFVETGRASMVMVSGVKTLTAINKAKDTNPEE